MIVGILLMKIATWCLLGFAGGWVAAWKGYPPVIGIVGGLLFGPLFIVIALLLPRTAAGREQAALEKQIAIDARTKKECPACATQTSAGTWVCGICGENLRNVKAA